MNRHAKAPSAGSIEGNGKSRGLFGRAFATRGAAGDAKGSGAPSISALLAVFALAICAFALTAAPALANGTPTATPTVTIDTPTASYTSIHVSGTINPNGGPGPIAKFFYLHEVGTENYLSIFLGQITGSEAAGNSPIPVSTTPKGDFTGLKPGTEYEVFLDAYTEYAVYVGEAITEGVDNNSPKLIVTTLPVALPSVDINNATEVGFSSAKATGEVHRAANADPAFDSKCTFEYITDDAYAANDPGERFAGASSVPCADPLIEEGDDPKVEAILAGLHANTTYHLRLSASNRGGGVSKEAPSTFTTQAVTAPVLAPGLASQVGASQAHISGTIDPEGGNVNPADGPVPINWELQYALASEPGVWQLGNAGTIKGDPAKESAPLGVSADLSNLHTASQYKFRLLASYAGEQAISTEGGFETEAVTAAPSVSIDAVTLSTATTAHLSGKVNPNGTDPAYKSAWHFQCIPACGTPGGIVSGPEQAVEADLTGLEPNTTYQVKLIAANPAGPGEAGPVSFKTLTQAPMVQTGFATDVEATAATFNAKINPHNSQVAYQFEYGPDTSYGTAIPVPAASLTEIDNANHNVLQELAGLAEDTTYHYRLTATNTEANPVKVTHGADRTFTTQTASGPRACPNQQLRAENNSLALPDCRAYEQVSPVRKNGNKVEERGGTRYSQATADGNGIFYITSGSMGAATRGIQAVSVARRGPDGWSTVPAMPPVRNVRLNIFAHTPSQLLPSADLSKLLFSAGGLIPPDNEGSGLYLNDLDGSFNEIPNPGGRPWAILGGSPDLSTVYFWGAGGLYEYSEGQLHSAATLPPSVEHPEGIEPPGGAAPASSIGTPEASGNRISRDGSTLFFVSPDPFAGPGNGTQLYVRRDGHSTLVSHAEDGSPAPSGVTGVGTLNGEFGGSPQFAYASADGSTAIFKSTSALTSAAPTDSSIKTYRYDVKTNTVTYLPGVGDGVVAAASDDGSRFLFGGPFAGIKLWDDGAIKTIYSGEATVLAPARATASGSAFIFTTRASIPGFNNGAEEIYRYDVAAEQLSCLSCPPDGVTPLGARLGYQALVGNGLTSGLIPNRGISTDADRVFFDTPDRLVPADTNDYQEEEEGTTRTVHVSDVYEWTPSGVSLISSGQGKKDSFLLDNSADGSDVFFATADGLDPRDTDGTYDVYDARVGGGYSQVPAVADCSGNEVCRKASPPPPNRPGPATNSFSGTGNPPPCPKGKVRKRGSCVKQPVKKRKHHKKHKRTGHNRGGSK